jgi:hypothetical protein
MNNVNQKNNNSHKCKFLRKNINKNEFIKNLELVKVFIRGSEYSSVIRKCKECGQYFFCQAEENIHPGTLTHYLWYLYIPAENLDKAIKINEMFYSRDLYNVYPRIEIIHSEDRREPHVLYFKKEEDRPKNVLDY